MSDIHHCIICKKSRAGRFTRIQSGASGSWSKGQLPAWYCWACLPDGQGRGETMPAKKPLPVIDVPPAKMEGVNVTKREGLALVTPLEQEVGLLETISTPGELAVADALFGRIQKARKTWKLKMYGTPSKPGPIPAIRSGLDQLYELNREVDKPLELLENTVEKAMKAYHLERYKEQQAEEQAKRDREAETQRQLDELERKKQALKTPAAKARVEQEILETAAVLDEIQQEEAAEVQELDNSTSRPKKMPVLLSTTDFVQGVADGLIPEDCVTVNMVKVRAYFKTDPDAVATFPGIELQDDIQIVGR